ncbi:DUF4244 domain-containing protein [Blastococcus sp. CT_GayMR19]|uniref:DUF4244 domain-containing protein n=1 Tax=Blastococcus sp. CT_GayMR19 TaxID=2559608 RepID=UPI00107472CC|nr:DUF4244 domain-containing protein [Blastococcus sp. CT_GayMR19]TFV73396.1 DUF4244 domain-containing protein [Blastococcus sp. CT_GayMR19]
MTSRQARPGETEAEPDAPAGARSHEGRSNVLTRRWRAVRATGEAGMSTAEYAVGTVAACAFAAVLYRVVTGGSIVTGLTDLVESALATLS